MKNYFDINELDTFLEGQLTLYKIEYAETGNDKYLQVMNDLNKAKTTFRLLYKTVDRLTKELNETK